MWYLIFYMYIFVGNSFVLHSLVTKIHYKSRLIVFDGQVKPQCPLSEYSSTFLKKGNEQITHNLALTNLPNKRPTIFVFHWRQTLCVKPSYVHDFRCDFYDFGKMQWLKKIGRSRNPYDTLHWYWSRKMRLHFASRCRCAKSQSANIV